MKFSFKERYLNTQIEKDLEKKMVFLSGPRQSGKTTTAKYLLKKQTGNLSRYLNYDSLEDRTKFRKEIFPSGEGLIVLDEIHKFSRWRQIIKGLYDKRNEEVSILITGSARLDHYRHGGDSLQGRYHLLRLLPLSYREIKDHYKDPMIRLLNRGPFPEPLFENSDIDATRWSKEYLSRLVREEIGDLETIKDISLLELLADRLPGLVGSPLSINSLREDLQVAHQTVSRWIDIFENMYMVFRVYPYGSPKIKAVKKESKHYHYDWSLVEEEGARFENMIAFHLLKHCYFLEDTQGKKMELRYFRDIDLREVDFVVLHKNNPILFIECKVSKKPKENKHLQYLRKKFPEVRCCIVYFQLEESFTDRMNIQHISASDLLSELAC